MKFSDIHPDPNTFFNTTYTIVEVSLEPVSSQLILALAECVMSCGKSIFLAVHAPLGLGFRGKYAKKC